jgi:hypothetical protein
MAAVPTSVTEYQTGFAPEIAPYAQGLLGQSYGTLFDYQKDPSGNIMYNTTTDDKGKDVQGLPKISGFKPYQEYATEDRFAQFTPLQQQAFSGAQGMLPSQTTAGASQLAGLAGLGALGTSYSPNTFSSQSIATKPEDAPRYDAKGNFQMGTSALGQYMNPYMQDVVARQQQDAQRQSQIAGQTQQAQAARSGAFGGSGDYLMRGQAAGNLARQKGDIQAQGLNSAYQQAMGQFNQEQQARQQAAQLNAQQQQYGAGLGLQGLQTALSGANTLGQLGQQQFGQGMDINKLQSQYGGEQQKQMQAMLEADYQNFINKQNYPYKQLGFMSDMIRGLPLSQTGSSVYQQPPSMLGQMSGLALGAASLFKKEGGSVHSYDNGGLTITNPDDSKLESMMDGMSNEQLQQIIEGSANPDARRVAQEELMSRASISGGMARGGVIAFANGGDEGERTSMAGDLLRSIADPITSGLRATAEYAKLKEERDKARPGFFEQLTKAEKEARIAQSKELSSRMKQVGGSSKSKPADKTVDPYDPATATRRVDFESKSKEKDTSSVASAASQKIVQGATRIAEQQGVPKETFEDIIDRMMNKFKGANDKDLAGLAKMVAEEKESAKSIMGDATRQALAKFGFQMAANASQPGAGKGIAGALRSAASAGPALSESMAESRKAAQAAQDNARRMQIEFTKYKVALNKGDQQLAISTASNLRMMQQQQAQLEETIRSNRAKEGLMAQRTAASAGRGQEKTFAPIMRGIGQANQMASKNAMELIKARPELIQKGEKPEDALERVRSALAVKYRKEAVPIFKPTGNIYDSGNDDMEE